MLIFSHVAFSVIGVKSVINNQINEYLSFKTKSYKHESI